MARLLITGASGLLGHTLSPFLAGRGLDVVRHGWRRAEACDMQADLADAAQVRAMMRAVRPAMVINLAALTSVDACEERPDLAFRANTRAVGLLADACAEAGARLIHVSTEQLYDGPGPHREDVVDILNVYSLSKYAGELLAAKADATILRTNFFGPSLREGRLSFSDTILAELQAGRAFVGFEDVAFTPLSMATVSRAIERVVTLALERPRPGVYNLGAASGCSKAEFAVKLARRYGLDTALVKSGKVGDSGLKARRPNDMRMDSSRFEGEFGFALPTLDQEIENLP